MQPVQVGEILGQTHLVPIHLIGVEPDSSLRELGVVVLGFQPEGIIVLTVRSHEESPLRNLHGWRGLGELGDGG